MNRYERIKSRTDGSRPYYLKEIVEQWPEKDLESMVLEIRLLTPDGGYIRISWSEKTANEAMKNILKQ